MRSLNPNVRSNMLKRADTVLESGLSAIVAQVVSAALSDKSKQESPLSAAMVQTLVLGTDPRGYAAACRALAGAKDPDYSTIKAETLGAFACSPSSALPPATDATSRITVVAGEFDYLSNKETTDALVNDIPGAKKVQMDGVGHWHAVEDPVGLAKILDGFFLQGT